MTITVELPDDVALHAEPGREALEALAIEGYKSSALTHHEAATLLGMGRLQFEALLKKRNILEHAYDVEDFLHDVATIDGLRAVGHLKR